jgi:uncharacterized SAM-binding protein YcdF (DUF218 family)
MGARITQGESQELRDAVSRALAGFLGALALLAGAASMIGGTDHLELAWLDIRSIPDGVSTGLLLVAGCLWLLAALVPRMGQVRRASTVGVTLLMAAIALANAANVGWIWGHGRVRTGFPVPLSLLLGAGLLWMAGRIWRAGTTDQRASLPVVIACTMSFALIWPLLQILTLGRSDYRRPADVAVVLGARVYADGRLSEAVGDRVRTAVELYREGWVGGLIMSGGPGDGAIHETEAMRDAAIRAGVPAAAIRLDREGLNTRATAANTIRMVGMGGGRMLAVSEFYHLPRIRLAYAVEGWEVCTVPARPLHAARWFPLTSLIREVPAYWLYYFRSVLPGSRQAIPAIIPALRPGSPFQSHTPSHAQAHAHPSRDQCHPGPRRASFAHPDC